VILGRLAAAIGRAFDNFIDAGVIERIELRLVRLTAIDLIDQDEVWCDSTGEVKPLTDLDDQHITNLKGWLLRNAPKLHSMRSSQMCYFAQHLNGEMALDAIDIEIGHHEQQNPFLWMEECPLLQAINRIIEERRIHGYVSSEVTVDASPG
jgi:hypothetical protein